MFIKILIYYCCYMLLQTKFNQNYLMSHMLLQTNSRPNNYRRTPQTRCDQHWCVLAGEQRPMRWSRVDIQHGKRQLLCLSHTWPEQWSSCQPSMVLGGKWTNKGSGGSHGAPRQTTSSNQEHQPQRKTKGKKINYHSHKKYTSNWFRKYTSLVTSYASF